MSEAHALVGQVAIVLGLVAVVWAIALIVMRREPGPLFLANLVWVFLAVAVAAALGAATPGPKQGFALSGLMATDYFSSHPGAFHVLPVAPCRPQGPNCLCARPWR